MFRFTIRDLLWLMVVVACLLGWWLEHNRSISAIETCSDLKTENNYYHEFVKAHYEGQIVQDQLGWRVNPKPQPQEQRSLDNRQ
jgi:hypothetical protein